MAARRQRLADPFHGMRTSAVETVVPPDFPHQRHGLQMAEDVLPPCPFEIMPACPLDAGGWPSSF
jgi:hypothetical protein